MKLRAKDKIEKSGNTTQLSPNLAIKVAARTLLAFSDDGIDVVNLKFESTNNSVWESGEPILLSVIYTKFNRNIFAVTQS